MPHKILVVDDHRDSAESLAMLLQLDGHEVRVAHEGRGALCAVAEFRPQLVFMDIGLPGFDGYEIARRIRAEPINRDMVLVALTGWGRVQDQVLAREAGCDRHVVKPIDRSTLESILAHVERGVAGEDRRALV